MSPRPSYGRTGNYEYRGLREHDRSGTLTGGQKYHIIPTVTVRVTSSIVFKNQKMLLDIGKFEKKQQTMNGVHGLGTGCEKE